MDKRIDEYNNIADLSSLMNFMDKYIQYGYVDVNSNIHVNELKGLRELYRTNDIKTTIDSGVGTCIEQTMMIKEILFKLGYETSIYCSLSAPDEDLVEENDAKMHSFVLAFKDDKCVYFEHANFSRKGIHVFNNEDEALAYIISTYQDDSYYKLYLVDDIPVGLSFNELVEFVKSYDLVNDVNKNN